MKSITVVMASYNGEKYIRQQIDSIILQSYKNFSLLVRDDGSSDSTQKILREYEKQNQLKWYTGEHINVAMGFIDLIKRAPESDYYSFCDQDDVWKEDKLKAAIQCMDKENEQTPLFYYSATTLVDNDLKFLKEHNIHLNRTDKARFLINDMSGNSVVINKKLRDLICRVDCSGISIHDKWALQVCLALGGKCIADQNSHILYRQHSSNAIGMELSLRDKIRKFLRIVNAVPDVNLSVLRRNFAKELVSPYKELVLMGREQPLQWNERIRIVTDRDIDFANLFFNIAFRLKVLRGVL